MATFVLLMLLLVALYLRVSHLGTENLWLDEAISVGIAKNSLGQVLSLSLDDFNPPLYRLLLHCWMWFFGDSELSVRTPSVIFGVSSVAVLYKLGAMLFNKWTGLMSALFLTLSAYQINYSQEARAYSMMVLLTLISFYFFIRLFAGKDYKVLIGYVLSTTALLYSHYYGLFFVVAQALFVLGVYSLKRYRRKTPLFRTWALAGGAVAALYIPGFLYLAYYLAHPQRYTWIPKPDLGATYSSFVKYTGAPGVASSPNLFSLLIFFAGISIIMLATSRTERAKLYLVSLWLVVPTLLPFVLSQISTPIYFYRYAIAALPALYLLSAEGMWIMANGVAEGVQRISSSLTRAPTGNSVPLAALAFTGCSFVVVTCFLSLPVLQDYFATTKKEPWREVASYIGTHAQPSDLLVSTKTAFYAYDYYAGREDLPKGGQTRAEHEEEINTAAGGSDRAWLMLAHLSANEQTRFRAALTKAKFREVDHRNYKATDGSIDLLLYEKQQSARSGVPPHLITP